MEEEVQDMQQWLNQTGKDSASILALIQEYTRILREKYHFPLDRLFLGSQVLHPQATAAFWKFESPDKFISKEIPPENFYKMKKTLDPREPLILMETTRSAVRVKSTDESFAPGGMTEMFEQGGFTDLYGLPMNRHGKFLGGITWATKAPGGFTEEQIQFLDKTMHVLELTIQLLLSEFVMRSLLCTYLGDDPGSRVTSGSVYRGQGLTVRSVLWFSDVRGFTSLSSRLDRDGVINLINDVFEVTEAVLTKHGGEILKFMGDGVLAIFTEPDSDDLLNNTNEEGTSAHKKDVDKKDCMTRSAASICQEAMQAAQEFQVRLKKMSNGRMQNGLPGADVGVGLHYGDCSYGNVGARARLDFTVIGSSVNIASRVEGLCSKVGASVLATDEFVKRLDITSTENQQRVWDFRGGHSLKGVPEPVPVYELKCAVEPQDDEPLDEK